MILVKKENWTSLYYSTAVLSNPHLSLGFTGKEFRATQQENNELVFLLRGCEQVIQALLWSQAESLLRNHHGLQEPSFSTVKPCNRDESVVDELKIKIKFIGRVMADGREEGQYLLQYLLA